MNQYGFKQYFRSKCLPVIVYWTYRLLFMSWRIQIIEESQFLKHFRSSEPLVFAHWHGHELAITHLVKRYRLATMTSLSKDGQLIDYVIKRLGGDTSKGSSSKGAVSALKGLIKLVKSGRPASVAVDGPRGPIYEVKPGVFEISRLSHATIIPVGVYAPNSFVFKKSWNKAILPKPFSKVCIVLKDPWKTIDKTMNPKDQSLAKELKSQISDACQQARNSIEP